MGAGASSESIANSTASGMVKSVRIATEKIVEAASPLGKVNKRMNKQIFESAQVGDVTDLLISQNNEPDENTSKLLMGALAGFFFIEGDDEQQPKLPMLIRGMQREEVKEGYLLIIEGESGSKLFVVESGELSVSINGEVIRTMGAGSIIGELALLYDAPRSATVKCTTDCILWSLRRDIFKRIQASASTAHEIIRSRGLINCPDLAVLSAIDISRLVGSLQAKHVFVHDVILSENSVINTVLLIERGTASIFSTRDFSKHDERRNR